MSDIVKRDGARQRFQRKKAEESLRRVGLTGAIIKSTLDKIAPTEGESTSSYRGRLLTELKARAPKEAQKYESTRRLQAGTEKGVAEGVAWVNPTTIRSYGWKPGESFEVEHGKKSLQVTIQESTRAGERAVLLNPKAMDSLTAPVGTRLGVRRRQ
jgi:hypothetical protein